MQTEEPDRLTLIAAQLIIHEMARGPYEDGFDDEYECLGWGYAEVIDTLDTYVGVGNLTDAYVCAVIERACERVALAPPLGGDMDPQPG